MKRIFAGTLVAMVACLVVGVAFADDNDDNIFALPIDKPEQNYGNQTAPGVPENIGPDVHNNTHQGENGWKAPPQELTTPIPIPNPDRILVSFDAILGSFVLWIR